MITKNWEDMSAEERINAEPQLKVVLVDKRNNTDLTTQFEVVLLLSTQLELLGFYVSLSLLQQLHWLHDSTQEDVAKLLGISENTYKVYRDRLEQLGLLTLVRKWHLITITLNTVTRLPQFKQVMGTKFRLDYLFSIRHHVSPLTEKLLYQQQQEQEHKAHDVLVKEQAKQLIQKEKARQKKKEPTFPSLDYKAVLDGYRKYKGIGFRIGSPDEARYRKSVKQMFLSGWTVFDIMECMKFFQRYHKEEGYHWMFHWTIETIMKKMPDFKAGTLKLPELGDDLKRL